MHVHISFLYVLLHGFVQLSFRLFERRLGSRRPANRPRSSTVSDALQGFRVRFPAQLKNSKNKGPTWDLCPPLMSINKSLSYIICKAPLYISHSYHPSPITSHSYPFIPRQGTAKSFGLLKANCIKRCIASRVSDRVQRLQDRQVQAQDCRTCPF